jgi:uridine phosphorylase
LWGYTGAGPDGAELSIQSTGMGGPSAAIVIEELIALGARRLVRVGTCGALSPGIELGELVIADPALACDGASRALGGGHAVAPDPELTAALASAAGGAAHAGPVASTDLFYDERESALPADAIAVEMEAATLFALAARRGVAAACLLGVSDLVGPPRERIDDEGLAAVALRLGEVAAAALVA